MPLILQNFVPLAEIERIYIDKVYYLGPDKGAGRSYHLLKEALASTSRAALASYAARGKCYLVLIRPMGEGLVMEQLKHQDELRKFEHVPLDSQDIEASELELAIKIIEQRVNENFEPENYEDVVHARMTELIQQKVDGQEIAIPTEAAAETKIVDLMQALQASVEKSANNKAAATKSSKQKSPRKSAARAGRKSAGVKSKACRKVDSPKRKLVRQTKSKQKAKSG